MKPDVRFLSLFLVIFAFSVALESSAQSFYPSRYGKRGDGAEEGLLRGTSFERRSAFDTFYGSRYGKRSPNEAPTGNSPEPRSSFGSGEHLPANNVEYGASVFRERYERSPESRNRFYFGPRFGKRHGFHSGQNEGGRIPCRLAGARSFYDCLGQVF